MKRPGNSQELRVARKSKSSSRKKSRSGGGGVPAMGGIPMMMAQAEREKGKGDLRKAGSIYERILDGSPGHAEARYNLALIQVAQKKLSKAGESLKAVLDAEPDHLKAIMTLGFLHSSAGNSGEAEACFREAVRRHPGHAEAYYMIGLGLKEQGLADEAGKSLREAIRLNADYAQAHFNLGDLLRDGGDVDAAEAAYREAVRIDPNYLHAFINLGATLHQKGEYGKGAEALDKALALDPSSAEAHFGLGTIFQAQKKFAEASECLRQAIRLDPAYKEAHINLGDYLAYSGNFEESYAVRREMRRIFPDDVLLKLNADTYCPGIFNSTGEMDARRAEIETALDGYSAESLDFDLENMKYVQPPPYYMHFHGRNEKPWKCKYTALFAENFRRKYPEYMTPIHTAGENARSRRPIRVGFVTTDAHEGPFLLWLRGLMQNLSREKFEVTILCYEKSRSLIVDGFPNLEIPGIGSNSDIELFELNAHSSRATIEKIRERKFDVLLYNEVGTHMANYLLPFFRLAPVQCGYWCGSTSGSPEMDYFISSELVEPEESQDFFLEKLVRLKSPMIHFTRPKLPETPRGRAHFGLPESAHLYSCLQSLHKIHPDIDQIFGDILRKDADGLILVLEGMNEAWTEALMRRFRSAIPDAVDRIRMIPRLPKGDFMSLLMLSNVILDPIHHNGGTTSYESLATGTPIVTWPGRIGFGRYMSGLYRKMNLMDCVASSFEEYADTAVRLGRDESFRESVKSKILSSNYLIFEDMEFVREMEDFMESAVEEARLAR